MERPRYKSLDAVDPQTGKIIKSFPYVYTNTETGMCALAEHIQLIRRYNPGGEFKLVTVPLNTKQADLRPSVGCY